MAKRDIETYAHAGKERVNNPPVGLVTPETDQDAGRKTYAHDHHIDPHLNWAGKAEHTSFDVPTVDYSGVVYVRLDDTDGWKLPLIGELKSAGFDVDANLAFGATE